MKYTTLLIIIIFYSTNVFSQYYYNDIVATQQSSAQHQLLKVNKIRVVKAFSKEADNSMVEGFMLQQDINKDASKIITVSTVSSRVVSSLTSLYEKEKISKTKEESLNVLNIVDYVYDANGILHTIASATTDTSIGTFSTETHVWLYNNKNQPIQMLKIKDNKDTTNIQFVLDDNGIVIEEHWKKRAKNLESYYYYYNDKNNITDIVRFNTRAKKMLPDFMYEYDANNRIKQMIQVLAGGSNYNTWRYRYNENGLKQTEVCYDKQKKLVGSIEYVYNN